MPDKSVYGRNEGESKSPREVYCFHLLIRGEIRVPSCFRRGENVYFRTSSANACEFQQTKAFESTPPPVVSMPVPLPVEILEQIFKQVVDFPDVASTSTLSPRYPLHYDVLPSYKIKLSTSHLYALTLVCKQWNAICIPRLYRCLAIHDTTATDVLMRTLEHSQTANSGSLPPLGSFTRHLIIALSDDFADEDKPKRYKIRVDRHFQILDQLARCLPHLQTLSIAIGRGDNSVLRSHLEPHRGRSFAAVFTKTCAQSLRNLHLHSFPRVLFNDQDLRKLFESAPNLVTITSAHAGDHFGCPASLPYLPKLKYLALNSKIGSCDGTDHKDNQTPSLDHVHISPSQFSNYWKHLLSAQGARLTFVLLDLRPFWAVRSEFCVGHHIFVLTITTSSRGSTVPNTCQC